MEHLSINFIHHFVEAHAIIVYAVIVLGVLIEGEIVVIFSGIFCYLGSLNPLFVFLSTVAGGLSKSIIGYTIGYLLQRYHSHKPFLCRMERRISYFLPRFKERPFWSIFLSRFLILGIGWFTVIFSGYKKIPLGIYAKAESLSLIIWSMGIIFLGYTFGFAALSISDDIRKFIGIILIFFIGFFILEKIVAFFVELFNTEKPCDLNLEK
jgi:membrane protein DedA with SNARE-associated domain